VTIGNLPYSPAEIKAKSGDSVVWVNKDFVAHTATGAGGWDLNIESEVGSSPSQKARRFRLLLPLSPEHDGKDHRAAKVKAASTFSLPDQPAIDAEKVR